MNIRFYHGSPKLYWNEICISSLIIINFIIVLIALEN
jgi:hypothetical protein